MRHVKELKVFRRTGLDPGENAKIMFTPGSRELSLWNKKLEFVMEKGFHSVNIGSSSEDIRLTGRLEIE